MEQLISTFLRAVFVDNMIFAYYLGMCSFLAVSKNVKTALGLGVAVTFILVIIAFFRELLGSGTLLGFKVIPQAFYDFGYVNNGLVILPPMAIFAVAIIVWVHRSRNKNLQEN